MEYRGYGDKEVEGMARSFPPLLELNVGRHLVPKMRFLKYTLGGVSANISTNDNATPLSKRGQTVLLLYFGACLEHTVAPWHAFLMHLGLPHIPALLDDRARPLGEFLTACRRTETFCALCNCWRADATPSTANNTGG